VVKSFRARIAEIRGQVRKMQAVRDGRGGEGGVVVPATPRARRLAAMVERAVGIVQGVEDDSPFFSRHEQRNNPTFLASGTFCSFWMAFVSGGRVLVFVCVCLFLFVSGSCRL